LSKDNRAERRKKKRGINQLRKIETLKKKSEKKKVYLSIKSKEARKWILNY